MRLPELGNLEFFRILMSARNAPETFISKRNRSQNAIKR